MINELNTTSQLPSGRFCELANQMVDVLNYFNIKSLMENWRVSRPQPQPYPGQTDHHYNWTALLSEPWAKLL